MRNLMMRRGVEVAVLLLFTVAAYGDVISLPLNGSAGFYDINTPTWTYNFDLGVTFSQISHVYIDWSGEITGGQEQWMNNPTLMTIDGTLIAYLGAYPQLRGASVSGGKSTFPASDPFDVQTTFSILYGSNTWDNLLDGKENISIDLYSSFKTIPEIKIIDYGRVVLNDATLIVEGTIVPEPTTLMLFGFGFTQILRRKKS
jgi:hypothetical protein